jgi:hypothetical protein
MRDFIVFLATYNEIVIHSLDLISFSFVTRIIARRIKSPLSGLLTTVAALVPITGLLFVYYKIGMWLDIGGTIAHASSPVGGIAHAFFESLLGDILVFPFELLAVVALGGLTYLAVQLYRGLSKYALTIGILTFFAARVTGLLVAVAKLNGWVVAG